MPGMKKKELQFGIPLIFTVVLVLWGVMSSSKFHGAKVGDSNVKDCSNTLTREEAGRAILYIGMAADYLTWNSIVEVIRESQERANPETEMSWRVALAASDRSGLDHTRPHRGGKFMSPWNQLQSERDPIGRRFCFHRSGAINCCGSSLDTRVFAVVGDGTVFDENDGKEPLVPSENSIILIEVRGSHFHWMRRGDLTLGELDIIDRSGQNLGGVFREYCSNYGDGFHVMFADGEVWYLRNDVPYETFRKFCSAKDAQGVDRAVEFRDYVIERLKPDANRLKLRDLP